MNRIRMAFVEIVYVRIRRNTMQVRNVSKKSDASVQVDAPFSTTRLLVGEFNVAELLLTKAIKSLHKGLFGPSPFVVIHPLEMVEGGLSPVEEHVLQDLAEGSGASRSLIWLGPELSDQEVEQKVSEALRTRA